MTKEKLFRKEYGAELLSIARGDLESAEVLASNLAKGRRENVCFTAQQCIEKSLKAVICAYGEAVPLTHSIELLLDRLSARRSPPDGSLLIELTDFATIRRYEEGNEIITDADVQVTLQAALRTLMWAETEIRTLLGS